MAAADPLTLGAAPAKPCLPKEYNGALSAGAPLGAAGGGPSVSKPYDDTAPEIQELIMSVFSVYTEQASGAELSKLMQRSFAPNVVFDLPAFFVEGAGGVKTLAHLGVIPFWKVAAHPKLVTVQMMTPSLGRIDVEATLQFHPRFSSVWPASMLIPEHVQVHGTWTIVAKGDDDRIVSVTENLHNLPSLPRFARSFVAYWLTTAGALLGF